MVAVQDVWKRLPKPAKRWLERQGFDLLSRLDTGRDVLFLNHGYVSDDGAEPLTLEPGYEPHRHPIALYHRVAAAGDWAGADSLEVGCGRGGGADYVARTFRPRSLVAIDLTRSAIRFCRRAYDVPGLSFREGDAHDLPFPDEGLDIVMNVESSLLYERPERFFAEVLRVLRPGGTFLFADYRKRGKVARLYEQLKASGLVVVEEEDITRNVLLSMQQDDERKRRLVAKYAPSLLRSSFRRFAGVRGEGDRELEAFASRERVYLRFVLHKREAD